MRKTCSQNGVSKYEERTSLHIALAVAGDGALPISLAIKNKFKDCVKECVCKHCIVGWVI